MVIVELVISTFAIPTVLALIRISVPLILDTLSANVETSLVLSKENESIFTLAIAGKVAQVLTAPLATMLLISFSNSCFVVLISFSTPCVVDRS